MNRYFKHLKTDNIYKMIGFATNCTNGHEEKKVVIYVEAEDEFHQDIFVRDADEFKEKFQEV